MKPNLLTVNRSIVLRIYLQGFLIVLLCKCSTSFPAPDDHIGHFESTCYNAYNVPHIDVIPHLSNCSVFMKCVEDSPGRPTPVLQPCNEDLIFDFEKCTCWWPASAICYDPKNNEHLSKTFHCACPLTKDEFGNFVPDPNDDRCSNGLSGNRAGKNPLLQSGQQ